MAENITFTMIKPQAVKDGDAANILKMILDAGFRISALKMVKLSRDEAGRFYEIHKQRPFYQSLIDFMTSGPVIAAVLEKENAVADFRKLIGPTDPEKATEGTVRFHYGKSIQSNAVHGSDSDENALLESGHFFSGFERY